VLIGASLINMNASCREHGDGGAAAVLVVAPLVALCAQERVSGETRHRTAAPARCLTSHG